MPWHMVLSPVTYNCSKVIMSENDKVKHRQIKIDVPDGCMARTAVVPLKFIKKDYYRGFSEATLAIATDEELLHTDLRVLLGVIALMEYENVLDISQQALGQALGIKQPNIAKSIKKLVEKGYLQVMGQRIRQNVYRVNPYFAFKTRAKNLHDLQENWDDSVEVMDELANRS